MFLARLAAVRDFQGGEILAGDDPLLAAVVELDVGTSDLQQCADSIPAQDFHVFTPGQGGPWFSLEAEELVTPFWTPFPWSSLRRL